MRMALVLVKDREGGPISRGGRTYDQSLESNVGREHLTRDLETVFMSLGSTGEVKPRGGEDHWRHLTQPRGSARAS